eukprot:GHVU01188747.1.p1 GENE.GHVU01188747.1~~GHVU01188747.1.p1  ORF type:complete len:101 (+),score=7.61 GHVU01188747.1:133-435(+)
MCVSVEGMRVWRDDILAQPTAELLQLLTYGQAGERQLRINQTLNTWQNQGGRSKDSASQTNNSQTDRSHFYAGRWSSRSVFAEGPDPGRPDICRHLFLLD